MRIIFMGTPEFAVPSLDILVKNGYEVVAVVTATDKLLGRDEQKRWVHTPVKAYALEHNIPVLQPEKLRDPAFISALESYKADLQIVVAFRMLPEMVWNMPRLGTMNLHGSLLPKFRGAAPINWAIINGESETGVTTFFLKHEIDTGDILLRDRFEIGADDNAGVVHDKMMQFGAAALLKSVQIIEKGDYTPLPQNEAEACPAPKLFLDNCEINFNQNAQQVHNFVRGLSPYPAAWTMLDTKILKIFKTSIILENHSDSTGTFLMDKNSLRIACNDGFVEVLELQLAGKKRMQSKEFLNGYKK